MAAIVMTKATRQLLRQEGLAMKTAPPIIGILSIVAVPAAGGGTPPPNHAVMKQCTLVVDGKQLVRGRCSVFLLDHGGYTINTSDLGKPRQPHFAQVNADADGTGDATWNEDPSDDHAQDSLGRVRQKNGCWVNSRVRICVR